MHTALRLAIAEDERDTREYLQMILTRQGHNVVVVAENGRQLVDGCEATPPDLIISDIRLPEMDGISAAAAINRRKQTPVILVSAHHDDETLARVAGEPVMGFLVKPVNEADLKVAIAVAMPRFKHFIALQKEVADQRQALEDRKIIERAKGILMRRLMIDEEEAFRRLRTHASEHNLKLVEVSRKLLGAEDVFARFDGR